MNTLNKSFATQNLQKGRKKNESATFKNILSSISDQFSLDYYIDLYINNAL